MIVVDANVIVYWATEGPHTEQAEHLRTMDGDWRTAPLWRYEFTNAILMMMRAGMLTETLALDCLLKADGLMTPREHAIMQGDALRVAGRYGISAHDAQYIALAEQLHTRCVTNDKALARKVPGLCVLLSTLQA
jgi:predicted nucleic acid-binding protein